MSVLVSRPAPDFTASAVIGSGETVDSFTLSKAIKDKKTVLFFYLLDFSLFAHLSLLLLLNASKNLLSVALKCLLFQLIPQSLITLGVIPLLMRAVLVQ
jgi:hypothetical protein